MEIIWKHYSDIVFDNIGISSGATDVEHALRMAEIAVQNGCDPTTMDTMYKPRSMIFWFINSLPTPDHQIFSDDELARIIHKMIEMGCSIESCDGDGNTPLLLACKRVYPQLFRVLLRIGGNVKAVNSFRSGVLHLLLIANRSSRRHDTHRSFLLAQTLQMRCDPNLLNIFGCSPSDCVEEILGHKDVVQFWDWNVALELVGYSLYTSDSTSPVVLWSESETLPISSLHIDDWNRKRLEWIDEISLQSHEVRKAQGGLTYNSFNQRDGYSWFRNLLSFQQLPYPLSVGIPPQTTNNGVLSNASLGKALRERENQPTPSPVLSPG